MNKYLITVLMISLQLIISCNNTEPKPIPTSGIINIDSRVFIGSGSYFSNCFSFSQGELIEYPNSQDIIPDINVLVHQSDGGQILGVYFASPDLFESFSKVYFTNSADSAKIYYDSILEIQDSVFTQLAIPVTSNEIWVIKTRDNRFGKILILETTAYNDSSTSATPTPYGEVTFEWVFQPDGSRQF